MKLYSSIFFLMFYLTSNGQNIKKAKIEHVSLGYNLFSIIPSHVYDSPSEFRYLSNFYGFNMEIGKNDSLYKKLVTIDHCINISSNMIGLSSDRITYQKFFVNRINYAPKLRLLLLKHFTVNAGFEFGLVGYNIYKKSDAQMEMGFIDQNRKRNINPLYAGYVFEFGLKIRKIELSFSYAENMYKTPYKDKNTLFVQNGAFNLRYYFKK